MLQLPRPRLVRLILIAILWKLDGLIFLRFFTDRRIPPCTMETRDRAKEAILKLLRCDSSCCGALLLRCKHSGLKGLLARPAAYQCMDDAVGPAILYY